MSEREELLKAIARSKKGKLVSTIVAIIAALFFGYFSYEEYQANKALFKLDHSKLDELYIEE